jgi:hypothetical protein
MLGDLVVLLKDLLPLRTRRKNRANVLSVTNLVTLLLIALRTKVDKASKTLVKKDTKIKLRRVFLILGMIKTKIQTLMKMRKQIWL